MVESVAIILDGYMDIDFNHNADKIVNGVTLPRNVVIELKRLGRALEWYNSGELESAVKACAVDMRLIDDHEGINFMDQLELTDSEKQKYEMKNNANECEADEDDEYIQKTSCKSNMIASFCKHLKERRVRHVRAEKELCCA